MSVSATYYLDAPSLGSASVIYSDAALTTIAADGYYSDGIIVREQVSGVLLPQEICPSCNPVSYNCVEGTCVDPGDGTGTYATLEECIASCGASPVLRIDWNVGNQDGGQLIIYNASMVEILNITSTSSTPQNGTIFPLVSDTPFTVRGQWVSGSGNIVRYNICNVIDSTTVFTSGVIDISTPNEDYLVSPTPVHTLVHLTAENVPVPTCPI